MAALLAPFLVLLAARSAAAVPSQRELGGVLLGQSEAGLRKGLGEPKDTGKRGDDRILVYVLAGAGPSATTLTFTIHGEEDGSVIGIQLSGSPMSGMEPFAGVALGDPRAKAEAALGKPDSVRAIPGEGNEVAGYEGRNFSVEYTKSGVVEDIFLAGDDGFAKEAGDAKPDVVGFAQALESRDRSAILDFLDPEVDLDTDDDGSVVFAGPARKEVEDEKTLLARYLFGGSGSLREKLTPAAAASATLERDGEDGNDDYDVEIADGAISLSWRFLQGKWRVWDVDMTSEANRATSASGHRRLSQ